MLSLLWSLTAPAIGSDGTDGVLLPGASPLDTTASIGASAAGYGVILSGSGGVIGAEASLRLSDRLGIVGFGGWFQTYTLVSSGVARTDQGVGLVSLRYLAVSKASFRVAP